jgi:D-3-phosphoglycerate dehydrogenase
VPDAVNVQAGGVVDEDVRPLLTLAEKLGKVFTAVAGGVAASVTVEVSGAIVSHDVGVLRLATTKGLFTSVVDERVTYVNAPQLAADRGVEVELVVADGDDLGQDLVTVRGALPDGRTVSVAGILTTAGPREICKLTGVDDFDLDLTADGVLLFFRYPDRPGIVGAIGTILGEAGVNIAAMQVARRSVGGAALMTLTVDSSVDAELLSAVAAEIGSARGSIVDLRGE